MGDLMGSVQSPIQGIRVWQNSSNKFLVFEAHYTADENKRTDEYRKDKESSLPRRKFLMEYEIHWESFSGLPVFGDTWSSKVHVSSEDLRPHLGLPLLIGFDFGLTPSALIAQLQERSLVCYKELVAVNMGFERFMSLVISKIKTLYPAWADFDRDWISFIDPSGTFRKDTDEGTCAKILDRFGFKNIIPGAIAFEERRRSVEHFLMRIEKGKPCFQVSEKGCPMLIKGFTGGYMFREGQDEIEPDRLRPLKNEYSHVHDGLQMICSRILNLKHSRRVPIPKPAYVWNK